jgi:hypothetical protein
VQLHPGDRSLRDRLAHLESAPPAAEPESPGRPDEPAPAGWSADDSFATALGFDTPLSVPTVSAGARDASLLADLDDADEPPGRPTGAPRRTVRAFFASFAERRAPGAAAVAAPGAAAPVAVDALFGDAASDADAMAATRLASGFVEAGAPGAPRAAESAFSLDHLFGSQAESSRRGYSFDQFFAEGEGRGAPSSGEQGAERPQPGEGDPSDLEAFNAWLEGLKR